MGINHTKQLGLKPDLHGNQKWILPHGISLQVEDYYQEKDENESRIITYVVLSNKVDMKEIILKDLEQAREKIELIVE